MHFEERLKRGILQHNSRTTRIAGELSLLYALASGNPDILLVSDKATACEHRVFLRLQQTPAPFLEAGEISFRSNHEITILFGRLFPAVPFEPYIAKPPFHPNISADDGFVCLWEEFDARRTIVDGITALRNILTWQTYNVHEAHLMQPEAVEYAGWIAGMRPENWPRLKLAAGGAGSVFPGRLRRFDIANGNAGRLRGEGEKNP